MSATSPEEICCIFQRAMADGDLDAVLDVYDPEAVFLNQCGKVTTSREELREALAPRAAMKARFEYEVRQVVRAGDIALTHTKWVVSGPERADVYAIEVARRQADGTWLAHRRSLYGRKGGRQRSGGGPGARPAMTAPGPLPNNRMNRSAHNRRVSG